ncbi:MAG: GNAT family N-acetyltransferase [Flavobacteriaceae bacterium]|nr:GNAT family N-acetyltransferase [Bacteroidia bacterium]NNK82550.1 GNAT family N-acetyltransferase [Flavobacteriaceae bacterium]
MVKSNMLIREIQLKDNKQIEKVIKDTFIEVGLPLKGTAFEDIETSKMFESYQGENEIYFVIEVNGEVLGGAGVKQLKEFKNEVCEIQKMYFSPIIRGKGYGKIIFEKCLQTAKELGYKKCYLESASVLKTAIHIYKKYGFKHLDKPLGNTGHYSCGVWMTKDL